MDGRTTSQRAVTTETELDWIKLDSYDAFSYYLTWTRVRFDSEDKGMRIVIPDLSQQMVNGFDIVLVKVCKTKSIMLSS